MRVVVDRDRMARGNRLLKFDVGENHADDVEQMSDEIEGYMQVLLGRVPPPVDEGVMTLMEVASAYFARGQEMNIQILKWEREGVVRKGEALYRFRTGELRSFIELAKRAADLGSRRLTHAQTLTQMKYDYNAEDLDD